jgi:hypothetical protein
MKLREEKNEPLAIKKLKKTKKLFYLISLRLELLQCWNIIASKLWTKAKGIYHIDKKNFFIAKKIESVVVVRRTYLIIFQNFGRFESS